MTFPSNHVGRLRGVIADLRATSGRSPCPHGLCPAADACAATRSCLSRPASQDRLAAVLRAVRRMRNALGDRHSLTELAQVALLSPFHFHRTFRQVTGATPSRFLTALRMAEARSLLVTTDMNITDVCFSVGYSSLGTFTTQFTRLVGTPPSRFRHAVTTFGDLLMGTLLDRAVPPPRSVRGEPQVVATVLGGPDPAAPAVVGLFPSGVPQGKPATSAVVVPPESVAFTGLTEGHYHVLATVLDPAATVADMLRGQGRPAVLVGAGSSPVHVAAGQSAPESVGVRLRAPQPTDPPIVLAVPLLMAMDVLGNTRLRVPVAER
ncbi:helix-turn-helix domain-containing protein [Longimycelium tulufanense]|nr:AraC family transcriptional regulator [Longimycelium tulufanense]